MNFTRRVTFALGLLAASLAANASTQFSEKDYTLYAGDFNGDGRSDLLYIGKTPDKPNGIALADSSGAPQIGFQSWPATYLGIAWSTGQYVPAIGDFNGDGKSDIFMQSATAGPSYVLLANTNAALGNIGQIIGISQGINQTDLGTQWSADQHKLFVGNFDGLGGDDVLLQATAKGGTNAIILTDNSGNLFTRNGSAIGCSAAGPQQCWTDGEQGLDWSTQSAVLTVGNLNNDARVDILYLPRPGILMIDYDVAFPVPVFKPNTFGVFLSQMTTSSSKVLGVANQLWSQSDLGTAWSPANVRAFIADFNGDGFGDVFLQSNGGSNVIAYGNSVGVVGSAVTPASNVAGWNGNSYTAVVGRFGNSSTATLYLQAKDGSGNNYYTSNVSAGSVSAYSSSLTLVANLPTPATTIGATPASADVTQNGSATYSIPIQLPRGTAGLTPELSLNYSSSSGRGLAGVGWNLSGLGMIARCPKTLAQDGTVLGVQLTTNDQYCLNGNRLRLVAGSQGQTNSQYRTELETVAFVTVLSSTPTGPTTWQVQTKDGLVYQYGGDAESRIGVPGNLSVIRVWALSKVSDRALSATTGNYWIVKYINDAAGTGAYYPDYIDYTTSSQATPATAPYRVRFYYENLNGGEIVESYYGGGRILETKRLQRIELQSGTSTPAYKVIRTYTLAYQAQVSTLNAVSRLNSVQECSPTACMAPTTFAWSDMQVSQGMPALGTPVAEAGVGGSSFTDETGQTSSLASYSLDINGDGIMDAVDITTVFYSYTGITTTDMGLILGGPSGQVGQIFTATVPVPNNAVWAAYDVDDDGKEDFATYGVWLHQKADGSYGLDAAPSQFSPNETGNLLDIDGDGFLDSVNNPDSTHLKARFHKRDGTSGFESGTSIVWTAPSGTTLNPQFDYQSNGAYIPWTVNASRQIAHADFNGDGRQDLLVEVNNGWRVLYSNGAGFTTGELIVPETIGGTSISYRYPPIPIDVNGDGCTDLAYRKFGAVYLAKSTCGPAGASFLIDIATGVSAAGWNAGGGRLDDPGTPTAADFNGDGKTDLMIGPVALLSNGMTLVSYATMSGPAGTLQFWSDRNGDGVVDYVYFNYFSGVRQYSPGLGSRANLLVSATDGFGKKVTYKYAPLSDSSVYTRGIGATGRTQDTQSSMLVVKTMTQSDGIGGTYNQTYTYAGAKRNLAGRGFLGFASREVTDSRTGFVTRETYNNSVAADHSGWELVGTLASKTTYRYKNGSTYGPKVDELTQNWWSILPTGNSAGRYPFVATSVSSRYELSGPNSPISTTTTSIAGANGASGIDGYGTVYDTTATTVEGISGTNAGATLTTRRYSPVANIRNDAANGCVGKLERVEDIRSHTYDATDGAQLTRVTTSTWDTIRCRVTHKTVAPGSSWQLDAEIEYDNFNNVKKTTVTGSGIPTPIITQADFGGNGHLQQTATNAKGHVTSFGWNIDLGFRTRVTDPNNQFTYFIPDDFGREKEMIRPDQTRTYKSYFNCMSSNNYCGDGLLRYVVRTEERNAANDPNNLINYSDQFVDVMGRVKYVQSRGFGGETIVSETLYDDRGNVALKTNPHFAGTGSVSGVAMSYDNLNRLVRTSRTISDTDRAVVSENVVYEGLKTRTFDANGIETAKTSNVLGMVVRAVDQAGKVTSYTYNSFNELLKATDPAGNSNTIQYNVRGFKDNTTDPDLGYWTYAYDALGQMLSQTDAKSQRTDFEYDELGRLKKRKDHPRTPADETNWTWDGPGGTATLYNKGQLYSVSSPGGYSETYTYDTTARRKQMSTTAAGATFDVDYGYDASIGQLSTVTYPSTTGSRLSVSYSYQNGFPRDVRDTSTGGVIWQANAQDARGHVTQEQYGNGQLTNLTFDQTNGRIYAIQSGTSAATQNLAYDWDRIGNLTMRRDNNQGVTETFVYDAVYRLTSVQRSGASSGSTTMSYDVAGIGNVLNKSDAGGYDYSTAQAGCTYYSNSQPHAVRKVGTSVYCYDANGNMVSRSGASVTWTTFNYPLTINQVGGNTSTFSYGADRDRYRTVSVDGGVTEDKLEIGNGAFEKVVSGTQIQYRHNILISGKAVAIVTRLATTTAPTVQTSLKTLYLHEDHLGSVDVITDSANTIGVRTSFDAWGQRRASTWAGPPSATDKTAIAAATRKGYTGHQQLDNLSLVHMNGRVYDPLIGRFMSADPIIQDPYHSQAFNRYSYVWNNPLNSTDPTGNETCTGSRTITDCSKTPYMLGTLYPNGQKDQNNKKTGAETGPASNQPATSQSGGNNSAQQTSASVADEAMTTLNPKKLALNSCAAATAGNSSPCAITDQKIKDLQAKGPDYSGKDAANPNYIGKVVVAPDGTVNITLAVSYAGDQKVAADAAKGIIQEYAAAGVNVHFVMAGPSVTPDLVIKGAKLDEFVTSGVACTCQGALNIGGWGPFANTSKTAYANQLLINGLASGSMSRIAAHEFGHKLGLTHKPGGIMDYPNQNQGPVNSNDVQRIKNLYP